MTMLTRTSSETGTDTHSFDGNQAHPVEHPTPFARFMQLVIQERADLWVLFIYTIFSGLLALAVPLAAQILVNTVAANVLIQPVVVLTILVFGGMLLSGTLQLLKLVVVERLQQRVFARVSLIVAERLLRVRSSAIYGEFAPELANRFFDVLTVQKSLAKLLLDGLTVSLQAIVGLVLLGVYSPLLLGFDIFVLLFAAFIGGVLGIGGLRTSIKESKEKYAVAHRLEEIGRCNTSFKIQGDSGYIISGSLSNIVVHLAPSHSTRMRSEKCSKLPKP